MSQSDEINKAAREKLDELDRQRLRRQLTATARHDKGRAVRGDDALISFCDNDYLGLSTDPRVIDAAANAAKTYGAGAGASRLVVGDCPLNHQVEEKLAAMKKMPAARLFGSGYLTNIGVIPVLANERDLIVIDALAHSCLMAGAQLSRATVRPFRHNDVGAAKAALEDRKDFRRALIVTETVFSMDGDVAPLNELHKLCDQTDAWLMTDDAHGFGVVNISNPAPIQMGTLSKAVGAYGGYVCGPEAFIDLLTSRARSLVYTTGLPPPVLGAALEALTIIETEPWRGEAALKNASLFCDLIGISEAPQSTIFPLIVGDEDRALDLSKALAEKGFLVTAIRPPTVPEGAARLRFTFTAGHDEDDVRALAAAVGALMT